jgi:hypothetical protein
MNLNEARALYKPARSQREAEVALAVDTLSRRIRKAVPFGVDRVIHAFKWQLQRLDDAEIIADAVAFQMREKKDFKVFYFTQRGSTVFEVSGWA